MRPSELLHDLRETGEDWADKKSAADALEEGKRNLLAQIITQKMARGSSAAKAQEEARCDEGYLEACKTLLDAQRAAVRAKVAYDLAQTAVDLYRTQAATRRAEMENLSMS